MLDTHNLKKVESDDEYEIYEEETYVTMEFDSDKWGTLPKPGQTYCMTGLDTDQPYFQAADTTFRGQYDEAIGTDILLVVPNNFLNKDNNTNGNSNKNENEQENQLKYLTHTTKKLNMLQIDLLAKKTKDEGINTDQEAKPNYPFDSYDVMDLD